MFVPKFVKDNLRNFVLECDFGDAYDESVANGGPIKQYVKSLTEHNITNNPIITLLMCLYIKHHNLQHPVNRQQVIPSPEWLKYFGEALDELRRERDEKFYQLEDLFHNMESEDTRCDLKLARKRRIGDNSFRYAHIISIINKCCKKRDEVTDSEKTILDNVSSSEILETERQILNTTIRQLKTV